MLLPRQVGRGMRVYPSALAISATVHDNVAVFQVYRDIGDVDTGNMIWYGPTGKVVRRTGNPRYLTRVVPGPKPTPPTALSRRAQRNPRCTGRASKPSPWVAVPSRKVAVLEARGRSCPGSGALRAGVAVAATRSSLLSWPLQSCACSLPRRALLSHSERQVGLAAIENFSCSLSQGRLARSMWPVDVQP